MCRRQEAGVVKETKGYLPMPAGLFASFRSIAE